MPPSDKYILFESNIFLCIFHGNICAPITISAYM